MAEKDVRRAEDRETQKPETERTLKDQELGQVVGGAKIPPYVRH